ncbi:MAG: hypothetical protein IIX23_04150 [Oscillospiraceae bacterium]|nr:hypothetical protein [Oscillospiraceae bacterium]
MRPTITLKITNVNNSAYPTIILRKFFNMVFAEPDGKTVNIYTATVFGGAAKRVADKEGKKQSIPEPKNDKSSQCILKFSYEKEKCIEKISFADLSKQYIAQTDQIKKVWKNVTNLSTQEDIKNALIGCYPELYKPDSDINLPDKTTLGSVIKIDNGTDGPRSHACIAAVGKCVVEKGNESAYTLCMPTDSTIGIEAINWIKTTIKFKNSILEDNQKVEFVVQLDNQSEYYTPDFTWYFAPPTSYIVDAESAMLKIGSQNEEPNKVTRVADATTVLFNEWVTKEYITERKKSRVSFGDITAKDPYNFSGKKIHVILSFINPGKHGNLQFFIGLIVAFLLSFCSDKTRLNDFLELCKNNICTTENCTSLWGSSPCGCSSFCNFIGIIFPFLIICAFFAICFSRKQCIPNATKLEGLLRGLKVIGLIATFVLIAYIYVGWLVLPKIMAKVITSCYWNQFVITALLLASLVCNSVYTLYCWIYKKKNIVDFF